MRALVIVIVSSITQNTDTDIKADRHEIGASRRVGAVDLRSCFLSAVADQGDDRGYSRLY